MRPLSVRRRLAPGSGRAQTQEVAPPTSDARRVAERLGRVRDRIAAAARQAGRDPDSVTLVAVSKRKPAEDIAAAYAAGQRDFGENYVQEFEAKSSALLALTNARFHLIGKLQSNKAKRGRRPVRHDPHHRQPQAGPPP